MIISASRRTDIPCAYSEWMLNRLKAGYVLMRNPMNRTQVGRVSLDRSSVDGIVFWTKDAENLAKRLDEVDGMGYQYGFQYTITPYGSELERFLRPKKEIMDNFRELADRLGSRKMVWRYDPILLNEKYTEAFHREAFARMCEQLAGYTQRVIISFVDDYAKLKGRGIRELSEGEMERLAFGIGKVARRYGLRIQTCCEGMDLRAFGIEKGGCLDAEWLEEICGRPLEWKADKGQRNGCGCMQSVDIGAYDTCPNGCLYCYANRREETAAANYAAHDPKGELLTGKIRPEDRIYDRK